MEILCETCHAKLNIPDEKLPKGQRVSVRCPRCQNKLVIDTPILFPEVPPPPDSAVKKQDDPIGDTSLPSVEEASEASLYEEMPGLDDTEAERALDSYGEGDKLALVMIAESHALEKIKEVLRALGYHGIQAENTREAVSKIQFQNFDLVILSDLFDNTRFQESPILRYLNQLSMSVRRKIFVLLMSDTFQTMDPMMAFTMSANLVANWKDLGRLSNILGRALLDNEKFYKVFMDTLKETGKA
jgi:predicted Zn finger-like uncharacterized protein